jgi:hypothetical protein
MTPTQSRRKCHNGIYTIASISKPNIMKERINSLSIYRILILIGLVILSFNLFSCSGRITKEEAITINKYTKLRSHDHIIIGTWKGDEIWGSNGTVNFKYIAFDAHGIKSERMYNRAGKPHSNWHNTDYYYTEHGKIFMYRPSEKGFLAMEGEKFLENEYHVSEDGNTLTIGDKTFQKLK